MSKIVNSILGFAIGDAMGVPNEFVERKKLLDSPVTQMTGGGTHGQPKGTWSDDTSMVLASMDSILSCHEINYEDMMKKFCDWINESKYTSNGEVFDIGLTTRDSLINYYNNHIKPTLCGGKAINNNGNGSLMRMPPIALYTYFLNTDDEKLLEIVRNVSSLTHGHELSILGCFIYVKYMHFLLSGYNKFEAYEKVKELEYYKFSEDARRTYKRFLTTDIYKLSLDYIKSSGYVVDTLEAVIWTFLNTNSFKSAIIGAINLGDDTDTIGALTGCLAGLIYDIDKEWLNEIKGKEYLKEITLKFDKELRQNILKYDEILDENYGIIHGNDDVFFIKAGANGSINGYQNKYLKIAKSINYKYGLTVIVAANKDNNLKQDFYNLKNYLKGNIYFMGVSNGGTQCIQGGYKWVNIKKMLLINIPLMINLHKTKEGIEEYKGNITFVYGSKDPSFNYIPLIKHLENVDVIVCENQDHNFSKGDEFLNLPEKYLFNEIKRVDTVN